MTIAFSIAPGGAPLATGTIDGEYGIDAAMLRYEAVRRIGERPGIGDAIDRAMRTMADDCVQSIEVEIDPHATLVAERVDA